MALLGIRLYWVSWLCGYIGYPGYVVILGVLVMWFYWLSWLDWVPVSRLKFLPIMLWSIAQNLTLLCSEFYPLCPTFLEQIESVSSFFNTNQTLSGLLIYLAIKQYYFLLN